MIKEKGPSDLLNVLFQGELSIENHTKIMDRGIEICLKGTDQTHYRDMERILPVF